MLIWRIGSYGVPYGFRQSYLWKLWMALGLEKAGVDQKKSGLSALQQKCGLICQKCGHFGWIFVCWMFWIVKNG